jgi:2-polyprenyl-3-methyl-5-hydroxy-6-metoxy-1,4-benzoquinol methylase
MTVSRIVDYDAEAGTYTLPPERATVLTGRDESCMAGHAQMITPLAAIETRIIEHFRNGGGVPYSAYDDLDWGVDVGTKDWDAAFVDDILPLAPGLVEMLQAGADVTDIGCGEGHKTNLMARAFPASRFTGYDFLEGGIETARAEAAEMGLSNITFEVRDAAELGLHEAFDVVCVFDAVHDQAKPRAALAAMHDALRPGGLLFMSDIRASSLLEENVGRPLAPYLYLWSICHCMTVSLEQGGEGLGAMWGEQTARGYLEDAGFEVVTVARPPADPINSYFTCRRATPPPSGRAS